MTFHSFVSDAIDLPHTPGAADMQQALAGLSATKVTLGEAFVIAQRAGDGDVFAVFLNKGRRAAVLSVRSESAPGRALRLSKVTIDLRTGAILDLESFTFSSAPEFSRVRPRRTAPSQAPASYPGPDRPRSPQEPRPARSFH